MVWSVEDRHVLVSSGELWCVEAGVASYGMDSYGMDALGVAGEASCVKVRYGQSRSD